MSKGKPDSFIEKVQKRVANIAISPSTVRKQGASGMVDKAREFLSQLDLGKFKNISEEQFDDRLEKYTEKLMEKFPEGAKDNFGAARKSLNVFLEQAFYNKFLAKEYNLDKLEPFLEVPLDNDVLTNLKKHSDRGELPTNFTIKNLNKEENGKFQKFAKNLAQQKGISRIYLDLEFWRS